MGVGATGGIDELELATAGAAVDLDDLEFVVAIDI